MAKARAIVKRRKAVRNIRKITRTMQLIATARFNQAHKRAQATKPYTEKITEVVGELSGAIEGQVDHPLLRVNKGTGRTALLVITSNRGLCGGYNSRVWAAGLEHFRARESSGMKVDLHLIGKKAVGYARFRGLPTSSTNIRIEDKPQFRDVEPIARGFIEQYANMELDSVYVAHMKFISVGRQTPELLQLLPLQQMTPDDAESEPAEQVEYDFMPEPLEILAELLPMTVKTRLYQCFTDAAVSEQLARMVAMKQATDAAEDMIKYLTQQYNRARQSQITTELLDIMGGAEALT